MARAPAALLAAAAARGAAAAAVLPNLPLHALFRNGHLYPNSSAAAPAAVDVFLGPFCEDSRRMWPTLQAVGDHYAANLALRLHAFPLPYNVGSWLPAQACVAAGIIASEDGGAGDAGDSAAFSACLTALYSGDTQKTVKTHAMVDFTTPQVITELVSVVGDATGVNKTLLKAQLGQNLESGASSYDKTKADWKHGTSVGVFSTPAVFVNQAQVFGYDRSGWPGAHMEGDLAALGLAEWQKLLDPLLAGPPRR